MERRRTRWRTGHSQVPLKRRRSRPDGMRKRDWIKILMLVGFILFLGLGQPLQQLDRLLGFFGFR